MISIGMFCFFCYSKDILFFFGFRDIVEYKINCVVSMVI